MQLHGGAGAAAPLVLVSVESDTASDSDTTPEFVGRDGDSSDKEAEALARERLEFGKAFTKKSTDKQQPAKELVWTLWSTPSRSRSTRARTSRRSGSMELRNFQLPHHGVSMGAELTPSSPTSKA